MKFAFRRRSKALALVSRGRLETTARRLVRPPPVEVGRRDHLAPSPTPPIGIALVRRADTRDDNDNELIPGP